MRQIIPLMAVEEFWMGIRRAGGLNRVLPQLQAFARGMSRLDAGWNRSAISENQEGGKKNYF
jgi:hypothetical protein